MSAETPPSRGQPIAAGEPAPAFELPAVGDRTWHRVADTALASPQDIAEPGREVRVSGKEYTVSGRSVVVLVSK